MEENAKKKVDSAWKDQVDKEKKTAADQNQTYHQPTFNIFLSSLSLQAMIALGKIENPVSGEKEENLEQARFLIDTIGIIQEKTKNNLTADEEQLLNESLYNLRMMYVERENNGGNHAE